MIMGTHSVTHCEKNECYTVPVPMLPTGSPVEWGPKYKIAWLELIYLKSYKQINLPSSILFCSLLGVHSHRFMSQWKEESALNLQK